MYVCACVRALVCPEGRQLASTPLLREQKQTATHAHKHTHAYTHTHTQTHTHTHTRIELCSEYNNCLANVCGMSMPNPMDPNQWWRFFTAIFLHVGIIHFVVNALFQLSVGIVVRTISFAFFSSKCANSSNASKGMTRAGAWVVPFFLHSPWVLWMWADLLPNP